MQLELQQGLATLYFFLYFDSFDKIQEMLEEYRTNPTIDKQPNKLHSK